MRGYANLSALVAMKRLVAVIDQQNSIGVRQHLRRRQCHSRCALFVGGEIVGFAGTVERSESDRLSVEMVLKQAVGAAGLKFAELN
jgi:hypothetical protein